MSTFSDPYVSRLLFATPALGGVVGVTARRWRRLAAPLFDPYRPEQHYMRGPGPKWRERQREMQANRVLTISSSGTASDLSALEE
jgi:hypothetical protein